MESNMRLCLVGFLASVLCACNITQPSFEIAPYEVVPRDRLPKAVINAFHAKFPSAEITETEFRPWPQGGKGDHFRISFLEAGAKKQIAFRENGSVLGQQ